MTPISVNIRPVEQRDAGDINALRIMPGVAENLLALPSERISQNEAFLAKMTDRDHLFCAEIGRKPDAKVIGIAGLHINKLARERHCAEIGIMIHKDYHGKGIGTKLMTALIDLADNWLLLKRLQLFVFPDNIVAIKLYEKFSFIKEGIMKYSCARNGRLDDIILMARYNNVE